MLPAGIRSFRKVTGASAVKGNRMPFVFYDLETTGRMPEFDQFVQFAAVETDDQFNEIDCFSLRCRLGRHIVPSPEALLVNRVSPAMLTDSGLPSYYEALRRVRAKLLEWSPAVFVGYNSISFDEDFLRQGFYQTLQPPYLTNTKGNARGDILRVARATAIYAPSVLKVPKNDHGDPVYRLDRLAPANGYASGGQHEAMNDVKATLFLASLIRQKAGLVWETMKRWTRKREVVGFLMQGDPVWHTGVHARNRAYSSRIAYCGQNPERDSHLAAFDLQFDPQEVIELPIRRLVSALNGSPKKIRTILANRQPIIMPSEIKPAAGTLSKVPERHVRTRVALIRGNARFRERVCKALAGQFPVGEPSQFVEQRIYDGFLTPADEKIAEEFHSSSWVERVRLLGELHDERARELGERLVYLEGPEALPKAARKRLDVWRKERIVTNAAEVPWMTVPKALAEVEHLMAAPRGPQEKKALTDIRAFLIDMARTV